MRQPRVEPDTRVSLRAHGGRDTGDYPGPVRHGEPGSDPRSVGGGWVESDFRKARGWAVHVIHDAAVQALVREHHA